MKEAEAQISDMSAKLFYDAFKASPIGIVLEDLEGRPLFVNPAFCSMLGFSEEELRDKHCVDFSPTEDADRDWALFKQLRTGSIDHYRLDKRYFRRDGSLMWGRLSISLLKNGDPPRVVAMVEDITEKKTVEETLELATEQMTAVIRCSRDLRYLWANQGCADLLQLPLGKIMGRPMVEVLGTEAFEALRPYFERVLAGEKVTYEEELNYRGMGPKWISATYKPTHDAGGFVDGWVAAVVDITDRKRTEELRFRHGAIVESSNDAIISQSFDGVILTWNKAAEHMFGFTQAEAVGQHIAMIVPSELRNAGRELLRRASAGEHFEHYETVRVTKEGKRVNVSMTMSGVKDYAGRTVGVSKIMRDISEQKRMAEVLKKSEEKFSKAFRHSPVTLSISSAKDHRYIEINETFQQLMGYSREEIIGRTPFDLGTWVDGSQRIGVVKRLLERGSVYDKELQFRRKNGEIWIGSSSFELIEIDGEPCVITTTMDVTARKRAEKALRESEAELLEAQRLAHLGSWHWDPHTDTVTWSEELYRIAGRDSHLPAPRYREFANVFAPESWERLQLVVEKTLRTGEAYELDLEIVRPDGTTTWITARGEAELDTTGAVLCLRGTAHDITKRKQAEGALLEMNRALGEQATVLQTREELLKIFVKHVPAGVAMLDREMRYLQVSDRWCTDYACDSSQVLGRSHYELFPDIPDRWKEMHRRGLEGESIRAEEDRWDREGGARWVRWEIRPWRSRPDSLPGGILIFSEDITRRKQMEEALSRVSQKLIEAHEEERTRVARELHDDINQRLALLAVTVEGLRGHSSASATELRQELAMASQQIEDLASDIQALSHRLHSSKLEHLGLERASRSFCREFSDQQGVEIDFQSESIPKDVPQEIELTLFRVLQESLQNATKHSGSKQFQISLRSGSTTIELSVQDSGIGFDPEDAMKGRGLGLVSMKERLKLVNGDLSIDSRPHHGATIYARVPLTARMKSAGASG